MPVCKDCQLAIEEKLGHQEGMANQYGNLGLIYRSPGELDRAEEMLKKSLVFFKGVGAAPQLTQVQAWLDSFERVKGGAMTHRSRMQRSGIHPGQLETALRHTPIASLQNRCNPFSQGDLKNGLVDLCKTPGVTYIAYSPVGDHFGHERLGNEPLFTRLARRMRARPRLAAPQGRSPPPHPGRQDSPSRREGVRGWAIPSTPQYAV